MRSRFYGTFVLRDALTGVAFGRCGTQPIRKAIMKASVYLGVILVGVRQN